MLLTPVIEKIFHELHLKYYIYKKNHLLMSIIIYLFSKTADVI